MTSTEHNLLSSSGPLHGHLLRNIVLFGRLLRALSIEVTPPQILDFVEGLGHIDIGQRQDFKNAARTVLINRPEHLLLFDRAFDLFWQAEIEKGRPLLGFGKRQTEAQPDPDSRAFLAEGLAHDLDPGQELAESGTSRDYAYSDQEVLHHKDFAKLTPEELAEVKRMMRAMDWQLERCRTRRKTPAPRGHALDMRRTLRRNLRYGGEPLKLAWRRPKLKRRPLVVICDVSGSMEQYARVLLKFIYVISNSLEKVEAFVFSTRLTRITRQLEGGDVNATLDQVAASIHDWGGGTRLGKALKAFNYDWGRRVLGRGAITLIVSDGLDRGDISLLEREMSRLKLSCHRLIWLNPLLGSQDYEPLARGMQAALPHIDDFLPVHNLASLEQLGWLLERLGEHHPWGPHSCPKPPS